MHQNHTAHASQHRAGSMAELVHVAWPLVLSQSSVSLQYIFDRIFLTWYSTDALAAAFSGGLLHWTLVSLLVGTASYTNSFVAQYEGAGQTNRVGSAIWQGVYFSLLAGALALAMIPVAPAIFGWFGHEAAVARLEYRYFAILCCGTGALVLSTVLSCFFSGRGTTAVILWVNVFSTSVNIVCDCVLVFGWGPIPAMGLEGAALGTVIAYFGGALAYVVVLARSSSAASYQLARAWRFDRSLFTRMLRYGFPNGFQQFCELICFMLFALVVGRMGSQQLAATSLTFNLNSLAFIPLLGMGTAVMTLVGHRIGEGRPELAERTTWLAFGLASGYSLACCALYLFGADLILLPYSLGAETQDFATLRSFVTELLRFVAVYAVFDAMAVVFGSATRGAGDTRFAFLFSLASGILLLVLPTYLGAVYWQTGLRGAWTSVAAFIIVMGVGYLARFRQGKWKSMRVIDSGAVPSHGRDAAPASQ